MTWKQCIDNGCKKTFIEKAERQKYIYVLYSTISPYLPVDFGFSLYEIAKRHNIPYKSIITQWQRNGKNLAEKFTIEKVYTE